MMLVQMYLRALTIVECWGLVVAVCPTLSELVVPCRQLFRLVERVESPTQLEIIQPGCSVS